jgi:uncharacterized protein
MLKKTKDLVILESNEKMILMNGRFLRPLIFDKGIDLLKKSLEFPNSIQNLNLKKILLEYKILLDDDFDSSELKTHQDFNENGKKELGLYLLVTQNCNLRCKYCLGANESYLNSNPMSFEILRKSIDSAIQSMLPNSSINFIFFGGEPLLNWELVKNAVLYIENNSLINEMKISVKHNITSNFTHIPEDFIEFAQKYGISVLIDIDGDCKIHNSMRPMRGGKPSYDKIVKNIKKLENSNVHYEIRSTITSENVGLISEISKLHKSLKGSACAFPTLTPVDSEGTILDSEMYPDPKVYFSEISKTIKNEDYSLSNICPSNVIAQRILKRELVKYDCGMLMGNTLAVTHDGYVYPCIYFIGQEEFNLGNVQDDINPMLQSKCKSFFDKYSEQLNVDNIDDCKDCSIRYICGGGCSVRMLSLQGNDIATMKAKQYFKEITCAMAWSSVESSINYFKTKT